MDYLRSEPSVLKLVHHEGVVSAYVQVSFEEHRFAIDELSLLRDATHKLQGELPLTDVRILSKGKGEDELQGRGVLYSEGSRCVGGT